MSRSLAAWSAIAFVAAFVLLAIAFPHLPAELPVLRNPVTGHIAAIAPKTLFLVFRVPIMNLIHGLMALLMLSHASQFLSVDRRAGYAGLFSGLFLTVALKALSEAIEMAASAAQALAPYTGILRFATAAVVILGITISFVRAQKAKLPWLELKLPLFDKLALIGLFALYIAVVVASTQLAIRA